MEEFVKVAETTEVPPGKMKKVTVDGKEILIVDVEGKYYAIGNKCTHRGGDLSKGSLSGKVVKCPRHGAKFDVTTGEVATGPAKKSETTFEVRVEGKNILIKKS
ncbi:MAG: non-heme iron oxygenase ferredoxin subunit [Candidatus Bathyarchaeota archaeon]|nr:non-heme iron oxygenase ferredoxin subunit [Candidatus Bathyarchaeota archaeon]